MNPDSFKGHVRWRFTTGDAVNSGSAATADAPRDAQFKYDRARRSLEIQINTDESAAYRDVVVELLDSIAATDGAKLKPWSLTFSFGAK
jgi:hypothetical protein